MSTFDEEKLIYFIENDDLKDFKEQVNEKNMNEHLSFELKNRSMLTIALMCGARNIFEYLLKIEADVNAACDKGLETALQVAIGQEYETIAVDLLSRGADINAISYNNDTPLATAVDNGMQALACYLVRKGADLNKGNSPLVSAICNLGSFTEKLPSLAFVLFLIDEGADVNYENGDVLSPLRAAMRINSFPTIKALHKAGCKIEGITVPRIFGIRYQNIRDYLEKHGAVWGN